METRALKEKGAANCIKFHQIFTKAEIENNH